MKLPRITAQTAPPIQTAIIPSGAARAEDIGALTRTGDQAMWRSVAQIGESLQDVSKTLFAINQEKRAADIDLKYSKFTQDLEVRDTTQEDTLINQAQITSAEQQAAALNEIARNRQNWVTERINTEKDPKARQLMQIYANRSFPEFDKRMLGVTSAKWMGYQVAERKKLIDALAVNGEYERANQEVDKIAGTLITDKDAENWKRDIEKQKILLAIKNATSTLLPEDEKIASELIEKSDYFVTEDEKNLFRNELRAALANAHRELKAQQDQYETQFDNSINGEMVRIDNDPDVSQFDFDTSVANMKVAILFSKLDDTHKRKLLKDLDKWRTGTGEVDYDRLLALNQEMDAATRTGIVDPTIRDRIMQANVDGAFGGRNKGGVQRYGGMIRRFEKLKYDERLAAVSHIVSNFERENADDPRLILLFHEAKNKIIEENPKADIKEIFKKISGLATSYEVLTEPKIEAMMRTTPEGMVRVISPDGRRGFVKQEELEQALIEGYKKVE